MTNEGPENGSDNIIHSDAFNERRALIEMEKERSQALAEITAWLATEQGSLLSEAGRYQALELVLRGEEYKKNREWMDLKEEIAKMPQGENVVSLRGPTVEELKEKEKTLKAELSMLSAKLLLVSDKLTELGRTPRGEE